MPRNFRGLVVSYRNSTSNHNGNCSGPQAYHVVSYRNSTSNHNTPAAVLGSSGLYLIEILHQTTTWRKSTTTFASCILSKFYIKPQHGVTKGYIFVVVSYRNSTSNHNVFSQMYITFSLYLIEILHQTTTKLFGVRKTLRLYLIEILHQTTTVVEVPCGYCQLYLIEILHQTTTSGLILIDKVLLTGCLPL